jgi:hypothetical protein
MAWTSPPRTWVASEVVSAQICNTHIRDQFSYLKGSAGSIIYDSGACMSGSMMFEQAGACTVIAVKNATNDRTTLFGHDANGGFLEMTNAGDNFVFRGTAGSTVMFNLETGKLFVGDTANANMGRGLTLNQAASTNEILTLKSSAIAHGMTDGTETDSYATFTQFVAGASPGGVKLTGYTQGITGVEVIGAYTNNSTAKGPGEFAAVLVSALQKSGTELADPGANHNIFGVRAGTTLRFIVDSEGDVFADAGISASAYDAWDDAHLGRALQQEVRPAATIQREVLKYGRADLERAGVATFNTDGSVWVNYSKLAWLSIGAHWQGYERQRQLEARIDTLTRAVLMLGGSALLLDEGGIA